MVTNPSEPTAPQVLAATLDQCTLVAVSGAATYKLAPSFKQATQAASLAGSLLIIVDMAACISMDSTFMGSIASLGFARRKSGGTPLVLINLRPNTAALLRGLGVDRILQVYPADQLPDGIGDLAPLVANLQPVQTESSSERELAALMYDAHETLTKVDPENLQRFKDVLAFLREDIERS